MDANTTIISALVTLVLAIFGASWLNQRATERFFEHNQRSAGKLLEQLEKRFDAKFDTIIAEIKRIDSRLDNIEKRIDRVERQLEAIFKPVLPK
ncbi:MAG TPA: hypothetical protein VNI84_19640 [Pyrinomonadaceae bacterium]|nr:hypothetical protein [Pyrinomonadaceae bacterium]